MGIAGLSQLISNVTPTAIRKKEICNFFGRKIAIDGSMLLYQFICSKRDYDDDINNEYTMTSTLHQNQYLLAYFNKTVHLLKYGIKPVFVFDNNNNNNNNNNNMMMMTNRDRLAKRTKNQTENIKYMLELMGVPYINALSNAASQCAVLAKTGQVYAVAAQDVSSLVFGAPILLRQMTSYVLQKKRKNVQTSPIEEIHLSIICKRLKFNQAEFVDLAILLGCDYCARIKQVGYKQALNLIRKYRNIDRIPFTPGFIKYYQRPIDWKYEEARQMFLNPPTVKDLELNNLSWKSPDKQKLIRFMCEDNKFNEKYIGDTIRLLHNLPCVNQKHIDEFFTTAASNSKEKTNINMSK